MDHEFYDSHDYYTQVKNEYKTGRVVDKKLKTFQKGGAMREILTLGQDQADKTSLEMSKTVQHRDSRSNVKDVLSKKFDHQVRIDSNAPVIPLTGGLRRSSTTNKNCVSSDFSVAHSETRSKLANKHEAKALDFGKPEQDHKDKPMKSYQKPSTIGGILPNTNNLNNENYSKQK
eukprot:CAMPEP_0176339978 /NCGR_PEP_ID=MMETSP0126-20121128/1190_1 /TAXON_ID=141414 ORGANISM="Strombidinopsis acuminatum, Strain SPMC142" /NCGR_SAMPLE_ID=MMETSP0126 /ASSEMBLY_ACC=CAM_ASM_000229 /LENGTH=173 /DNA_ID=CAMNT_0017683879 /DNA_START=654 /DNA_END=1175 /DNA_ORIENTATION=-